MSNGSVAKTFEISAESATSFEDAIRLGLERAGRTVEGIQGAWIAEQRVVVAAGQMSVIGCTCG